MYIYISNNIYVDINQSRSKCYTVQKDNNKKKLFIFKKNCFYHSFITFVFLKSLSIKSKIFILFFFIRICLIRSKKILKKK